MCRRAGLVNLLSTACAFQWTQCPWKSVIVQSLWCKCVNISWGMVGKRVQRFHAYYTVFSLSSLIRETERKREMETELERNKDLFVLFRNNLTLLCSKSCARTNASLELKVKSDQETEWQTEARNISSDVVDSLKAEQKLLSAFLLAWSLFYCTQSRAAATRMEGVAMRRHSRGGLRDGKWLLQSTSFKIRLRIDVLQNIVYCTLKNKTKEGK